MNDPSPFPADPAVAELVDPLTTPRDRLAEELDRSTALPCSRGAGRRDSRSVSRTRPADAGGFRAGAA